MCEWQRRLRLSYGRDIQITRLPAGPFGKGDVGHEKYNLFNFNELYTYFGIRSYCMRSISKKQTYAGTGRGRRLKLHMGPIYRRASRQRKPMPVKLNKKSIIYLPGNSSQAVL